MKINYLVPVYLFGCSLVQAAGYIKLPVQVTQGNGNSKNKRTQLLLSANAGDDIEVPLVDTEYYYKLALTIGTPGQSFEVMIDTGSSDLWVLSASNPYCLQNGINNDTYNSNNEFDCTTVGGTFQSNASSTFSFENDDFSIVYGDDDFAKGNFGTDVVKIEDVSVTGAGFGIGSVSNLTFSVLGIGLINNEATNFERRDSYTYRNLPALLKDQGLIEVNAYSLYLDADDNSDASLLFGAVDSSKYSGGLWTVPLVNRYASKGQPQLEFTVDVSSIAVNSSGSDSVISTGSFAGLLDSGTTLTYLPPSLFKSLISTLGATYDSSVGAYVVPKSLVDSTSLIFSFSGAEIEVKLADASFSTSSTSSNGEALYWIGFESSGDDSFGILGDTFLRSAYVVYNLDALEISLGQASFDNSNSDIEVISSTVPGAKPASQATQTASSSSLSSSGVSSTTLASEATTTSVDSTSSSIITTSTSAAQSVVSPSSSTVSGSLAADQIASTLSTTTSTVTTDPAASYADSVSTVAQTYLSGTLTVTEFSVITVCTRCQELTAAQTVVVTSAAASSSASEGSLVGTSNEVPSVAVTSTTGSTTSSAASTSESESKVATYTTMTKQVTVYVTETRSSYIVQSVSSNTPQFLFLNSTVSTSSLPCTVAVEVASSSSSSSVPVLAASTNSTPSPVSSTLNTGFTTEAPTSKAQTSKASTTEVPTSEVPASENSTSASVSTSIVPVSEPVFSEQPVVTAAASSLKIATSTTVAFLAMLIAHIIL